MLHEPSRILSSDKEAPLDNLFLLPLDVTNPDQCKNVVKKVLQQEGHIDVLINNAGQGLFGCAENFEMTQAKDLFEVNFFGPLAMIQEVLL